MTARSILHRLLLAENIAELIPTSAERLREQAFIDGRTDFSNDAAFSIGGDDFIAGEASPAVPRRYIFHMSFCGSTYLSRLLDIPGRTIVLREPNCLADFANQRAAARAKPHNWDEAIAAATNHLSREWQQGEAVIVKPSNWCNNLLPDLCAASAQVLPLFLTISRAAFLKAVLRGGHPRLGFTARCAVHLSGADDADAALVGAALASDGDDLDKLLALAAVVHDIQLRAFDNTARRSRWERDRFLTLDQLNADPAMAMTVAARALRLDLAGEDIASSIDRWANVHAKNPQQSFSGPEIDQNIDGDQARRLESALIWAERSLATTDAGFGTSR